MKAHLHENGVVKPAAFISLCFRNRFCIQTTLLKPSLFTQLHKCLKTLICIPPPFRMQLPFMNGCVFQYLDYIDDTCVLIDPKDFHLCRVIHPCEIAKQFTWDQHAFANPLSWPRKRWRVFDLLQKCLQRLTFNIANVSGSDIGFTFLCGDCKLSSGFITCSKTCMFCSFKIRHCPSVWMWARMVSIWPVIDLQPVQALSWLFPKFNWDNFELTCKSNEEKCHRNFIAY